MKELLDQVHRRYDELKNTISSQEEMITHLKNEKSTLKTENAGLHGQIMELNGKWNKIQKLLKGVKNE